jgi:hypothetical protein
MAQFRATLETLKVLPGAVRTATSNTAILPGREALFADAQSAIQIVIGGSRLSQRGKAGLRGGLSEVADHLLVEERRHV